MTASKRAELMAELAIREAAFAAAQTKASEEKTVESREAAMAAWSAKEEIAVIVTPLKKANYASRAGQRQAAERRQHEGR